MRHTDMHKLLGGVALLISITAMIHYWPLPGPNADGSGLTAAVIASDIVNVTNVDRTAGRLAAVSLDPLLTAAAQKKADDMAFYSYFAHISPQGKSPWHWLDSVGYAYTYAGENLAIDFTDAKTVQNAWMSSPAHRDNVLKAQYTEIGVGVSHGRYRGKETTFVVTFFATPR